MKKLLNSFRYELVTLVFPRSEYKELVKLTLSYLCSNVNSDIHAPGSISHGHFMAKFFYYLKMKVLSNQLSYQLTAGLKEEISRMAEFILLFYTVWFLRSSVVSSVPFHDIKATGR